MRLLRFFIPLSLLILALSSSAFARDSLELTMDFSTARTFEDANSFIRSTGSSLQMHTTLSNLLLYSHFYLPKNAMFRNRFFLEGEVTEVLDHGISGISLGNKVLDLGFYIFKRDRVGYARIAKADRSTTSYIIEKKITYPSTPFSLSIAYDVEAGVFIGSINGSEVLSLTSRTFPSLTNISSVSSVSAFGGSQYDQNRGSVVFSHLNLSAE